MAAKNHSLIKITNLTKSYGSKLILKDINLEIKENEFFIILGPSGCGKTTLLRILAGFEKCQTGEIYLADQLLNHIPPNLRPLNMVFQSYAVFPNLTVYDNIAYGLKIAKTPKEIMDEKVKAMVDLVDLKQQIHSKPEQLSGGQKQRVALARALVMKPKVLLLDEPLSALDAKLREHMQNELVHLQKNIGITFIMVTHDQREALSMADSLGIINEGKLIQVGTPESIYENPKNQFVANFVGRTNSFEATLIEKKKQHDVVEINDLTQFKIKSSGFALNETLKIFIRNEKIKVSLKPPKNKKDLIVIRAKIILKNYFGYQTQVKFLAGKITIASYLKNAREFQENQVVFLTWNIEDILILK